ncbi:MAG: hypothetical protein LUI87_00745 [Lachnospiraceae bacterium]|nr:hypothetical protein [Lachnospiraceae bacterium]
MEDWLTRALDKATEKGIEKGIEQGTRIALERLVKSVDSLMRNAGYSKERACSVLDTSVEEYEEAKKRLAEKAVTV